MGRCPCVGALSKPEEPGCKHALSPPVSTGETGGTLSEKGRFPIWPHTPAPLPEVGLPAPPPVAPLISGLP